MALAWGFAEGLAFFIVPDVVFTFSAGLSPRRALRHVGLVIVGSLIAGAILHTWASRDGHSAERFVRKVPFVSEAMFARVRADYAALGVWAPLLGPTSGTPYKVYAALAPGYVSLVPFLLVSIPARAERLLLTWAQFALLGWALRRWTRRPRLWLVMLYAVYWVCVYAVY